MCAHHKENFLFMPGGCDSKPLNRFADSLRLGDTSIRRGAFRRVAGGASMAREAERNNDKNRILKET